MQAAKKELDGLVTAKHNLEESVKAERDACVGLRGQIDESKGKQGRLRNVMGKLKEDLRHQSELRKKHEEEIVLLRKSINDMTTELRQAQRHCEDLEAAAQHESLSCACPSMSGIPWS